MKAEAFAAAHSRVSPGAGSCAPGCSLLYEQEYFLGRVSFFYEHVLGRNC
jgi:hypothetical protein